METAKKQVPVVLDNSICGQYATTANEFTTTSH
jgi:hypothetical protein